MRKLIPIAILAVVLPGLADDHDKKLSGSVELLYRNVDVNGNDNKYDEDFDGAGSGVRLGSFSANWFDEDNGRFDYARLDLFGLGGDPYQRSSLEVGSRDKWDLAVSHWQQDYLYDLFDFVSDEDGASWDAQRQQSDVRLRILPNENLKLIFSFQETERTGDSLVLRDISREVFQLDAPLDQQQRRYTVGADFSIGKVNVVFRQMQREYENRFDNLAENNSGIEDAQSAVAVYDWRQLDEGDSSWTTLTLSSQLGKRADFTFNLFGTLLGEEEITSDVDFEVLGTNFSGNPFGGECAATSAVCNNDDDCDAVTPGDVCVPLSGISDARLEGDTLLAQLDLGFDLSSSVALNLQYESFDRDLNGQLDRDLDGDGTFEDPDDDGTDGTTTRLDHQLSTATVTLHFAPSRIFSGRVGYRLIDHELTRSGFGDPRDADYDSGDDETIVLGFVLSPIDWLRLTGDYEEGDVEQAFVSTSLRKSDHLRLRARVQPRDTVRLDFSYRDFENQNLSPNFRTGNTVIDFDHVFKGTSYSAEIWHQAAERVRWTVRYAMQEVDSNTGIEFDDAGFSVEVPGQSLFINDNTELSARVDFGLGSRTDAYVRFSDIESDGDNTINDLTVPTAPVLVGNLRIIQDFQDIEAGFNYRLDSGLYVGFSYRDFDYDDLNDLLDYDSGQAIVRVGLEF